jgi:hypothetical protein
MLKEPMAKSITDALTRPSKGPFVGTDNVVDALYDVAHYLNALGMNGATDMGAVHVLSLEVQEGSQRIADGLHAIAAALAEISGKLP